MNTIVDFEIAKLLKDKAGKEIGYSQYAYDKGKIEESASFAEWYYITLKDYFYAPTIAQVVMWLYEKHNIWISVVWGSTFYRSKFHYQIQLGDLKIEKQDFPPKPYNTPTQAYSEAIKYTLTHLI